MEKIKKITSRCFIVVMILAVIFVSMSCSFMAKETNYSNAYGIYGTYFVQDEAGEDVGTFKDGDDLAVGDTIAFYVSSADPSGVDYIWSLFDPASDEVKEVSLSNFIVVDEIETISGDTIKTSVGYETTSELVLGEEVESAWFASMFAKNSTNSIAWTLIVIAIILAWIDLLFKEKDKKAQEEKEQAKAEAKAKADKEKSEAKAKSDAEKSEKEKQMAQAKAVKDAADKEEAEKAAAAAVVAKNVKDAEEKQAAQKAAEEKAAKEAEEKAKKEAEEEEKAKKVAAAAAVAAAALAAKKAKQEEKENAKAEKAAAKEKAKAEKEAEKERIAKEKEEAAKAAAIAAAALAAKKAEEEKIAKEAEEKRLAEEKAEKERLAKEAEAKRIEEARIAEEKRIEDERIAAEKAEADRIAAEKAAKAAAIAAAALAAKKAEEEKIAKEAEEKRLAEEKAENERLAKEAEAKRIEDARIAAEKAEADRLAKIEADRIAKEKAEAEAKRQREERMANAIKTAAAAAAISQAEDKKRGSMFAKKFINNTNDNLGIEDVDFPEDFFDKLGEVTSNVSLITSSEIRKFIAESMDSDVNATTKKVGRDIFKISYEKSDFGYVQQVPKSVIMEVNLPVKYAKSIMKPYGITQSVVIDNPNWFNWILNEETTTEQVSNVLHSAHYFARYKCEEAAKEGKDK
ncbi:MAG: hypothetical protein R3Y65_05465 [Bacillota bacterium]